MLFLHVSIPFKDKLHHNPSFMSVHGSYLDVAAKRTKSVTWNPKDELKVFETNKTLMPSERVARELFWFPSSFRFDVEEDITNTHGDSRSNLQVLPRANE